MLASLVSAQAARAQSFDGRYTGKLDCAKLAYTDADLSGEPVSLTISGGKVSYARTLYEHNRSEVVGKETGAGSVTPDGSITLSAVGPGGAIRCAPAIAASSPAAARR
jgi:hypothetical protein